MNPLKNRSLPATPAYTGPLGRHLVALPETYIDTFDADVPAVQRPTFNMLWNAFGFLQCDILKDAGGAKHRDLGRGRLTLAQRLAQTFDSDIETGLFFLVSALAVAKQINDWLLGVPKPWWPGFAEARKRQI